MKFRKSVLAFSLGSALLALSLNAQAGTRDLVFEDEEETPAAETADADMQTIAVKTTVLLTRDGKETTVSPNEEFKSGDKVKLMFTSNVDGYVYWLAQGSSGEYAMLFPNAQTGMDNAITRNTQYTVPSKGAFRFDDTPGNETLLCILSTERMPDLDQAAGMNFSDPSAVDQLQEERKSSTRDLVFEEEDEEDINTAQQSAPVGEPFVVQYVLKHN